MKGRKPIPIELHLLKGNPGRRPVPDPIPAPRGRPEPPPHLDDVARVEWEHACDLLDTMGLLSKADVFALELFCETWTQYRVAVQNCQKYGMVQCLNPEKRKFAINPYWRVRNVLWEQVYKLLGEFGFTPVARARLKAGGQESEDDDPLVAMMKNRAARN